MFGLPLPTSLQRSLDSTKVQYTQVGASGLRVSWPVLGAMSFGQPQAFAPWVLNEEVSLEVLKAAYDCGINTWDTSNVYSNGLSEEIIGKAMKKFEIPRQKLVIMTKCAFHVGEEIDVFGAAFVEQMNQCKDYVNQGGLTRIGIFNAVESSLERLGTTYIDLLQIQRYDPLTPPEETMKALHDLVQMGKVRYIGASSMWATQFAEMQFIAEKNGWTKFVSMQNYYNLCYREEEREMIRFCKETGVGIIPWSPLYAGRLARPLGHDASLRSKRPSPHHPTVTPADEEIIRRVEHMAGKKGWKMSHVALAWQKSKGTVPIVGCTSVERIEDLCDLRDKFLTKEEINYLEDPYVPKPVAGHY
ncbi:NADP-dependent oxidoreductase domain-containing protein [Penicillium macrosclerotiorum]|uniref:NADP-dependent oxidoreductase domain-containing protein n=1 Tax=Penicillium macrosclerotiorum TaxID=303699 RepID=UPI002546F2CD|nr:NADP-dependent oxidoreductase domain-containing protein [Penicillium macrosclerotiorum]KAJ5664594.1 NADP-dependent oxidoreductase domain-containing protein [Penicillium macrosclerotiorum]